MRQIITLVYCLTLSVPSNAGRELTNDEMTVRDLATIELELQTIESLRSNKIKSIGFTLRQMDQLERDLTWGAVAGAVAIGGGAVAWFFPITGLAIMTTGIAAVTGVQLSDYYDNIIRYSSTQQRIVEWYNDASPESVERRIQDLNRLKNEKIGVLNASNIAVYDRS